MFLPPTFFSAKILNATQGPCLLLPLTGHAEPFIVTGVEPARAIMLAGSHAGYYMNVDQGAHYSGLEVHPVEIEVDHETAFVPTYVQRPILSFIQGPKGSGIVARGANSPIDRGQTIAWVGEAPQGNDEAVGFTSWNAYVRNGEDKVVVHSHRGEPISRD